MTIQVIRPMLASSRGTKRATISALRARTAALIPVARVRLTEMDHRDGVPTETIDDFTSIGIGRIFAAEHKNGRTLGIRVANTLLFDIARGDPAAARHVKQSLLDNYSAAHRNGSVAMQTVDATLSTAVGLGAARGALEIFLEHKRGNPSVAGTVRDIEIHLGSADRWARRATDLVDARRNAIKWDDSALTRARRYAVHALNDSLRAVQTAYLAYGGHVDRQGIYIKRALFEIYDLVARSRNEWQLK